MQSKIEEKAKHYFESISGIENLNAGGCLFAAYGVYLKLKQDGFNIDDVVIVQLSCDSKGDIEQNKSFLKGDTQNSTSSSHFALSVDGGETFLDANDCISQHTFNYHLLIPSSQVIKFSENCLRDGHWNWNFVRDEGVPMINEILGINLKY